MVCNKLIWCAHLLREDGAKHLLECREFRRHHPSEVETGQVCESTVRKFVRERHEDHAMSHYVRSGGVVTHKISNELATFADLTLKVSRNECYILIVSGAFQRNWIILDRWGAETISTVESFPVWLPGLATTSIVLCLLFSKTSKTWFYKLPAAIFPIFIRIK